MESSLKLGETIAISFNYDQVRKLSTIRRAFMEDERAQKYLRRDHIRRRLVPRRGAEMKAGI